MYSGIYWHTFYRLNSCKLEAHPVLHFIKSSGSKHNPEYQTKQRWRVATSEYSYFVVSLYTRLDKSYIIFLPYFKSPNSSFVVFQSLMYLTAENTVQDYEKIYIDLKLMKVIGNTACSFWNSLCPTVAFKQIISVRCLSWYTLLIGRSVTFIEAEGIQRLHANTSQFCFFLFSFKFYCSFFLLLWIHMSHSTSLSETWALMSA